MPINSPFKDETGAEKYFVEGELMSLGNRLHIKDSTGVELALISEKLLTLLPKFTISIKGSQVAEIVQQFTLIKPKYVISGLNWDINGDFWAHDYTITKDNTLIASIHKMWMTWGDCFEIDLNEGTDEIMALSVVLAIDCVLDAGEHRK